MAGATIPKGHVHRSAYTLEDQERMSRAENYFAWQSRLVARELGRRVVEVGCGLGNFTGMLLRQALHGMASILGPGGVIVLLVPAFPALYGPIDSNLGHCRRYNCGSIARLADATGLRIRKIHYVNAAGFFGWWVNAHILRRRAQSERQIEIFDRYLVPLLSRLEGLVSPPFGQSLFVVLEKP